MEAILGLGLALPIVASTGIATTTAVAQGVSEQKKQNAENNNEARMHKFHLDVYVEPTGRKGKGTEVHGGIVVTRNDKLYVEPANAATRVPKDPSHHPFTGFYLAYPDENRPTTRGMVSTISDDPPMLNWIYVDKDTMEVKYSNRSGSIAHHVGDFDWTQEDPSDSDVTFDGWEGFLAVEEKRQSGEERSEWALYFDMDDDGLKKYKKGRKTVEVSLVRRVINQETNQWGVGQSGNIGVKATREV